MWKNFLKADFYRAFSSMKIWLSSVGVFFASVWTGKVSQQCPDVLSQFDYTKWTSFYILIFFFGSLAFSDSMLEDKEHGFLKQQILRCGRKAYVSGRSFSCFVSATFAISLGSVFYVLYLCQGHSTAITETNRLLCMGSFWGWFALNGMPAVFYLGTILITGMLGGILSLASMLLSMVAGSRLLASTLPVAGYYVFINWFISDGSSEFLNFGSIFLLSSNAFESRLLSFLYACGLLMVFYLLFKKAIAYQVEREVEGRV